ncbi:hypothetical protein PoMZ_12943 [Pyricularia oryzae]|uniref:Uncharacterized protein n=1 Tax=Pyricularia oryzae TaxID=318829 RepID=A0A4P7NVL1_PYROR|nr:hypothetical protein PoMZ_12943 [Pyricularia oryzae]
MGNTAKPPRLGRKVPTPGRDLDVVPLSSKPATTTFMIIDTHSQFVSNGTKINPCIGGVLRDAVLQHLIGGYGEEYAGRKKGLARDEMAAKAAFAT